MLAIQGMLYVRYTTVCSDLNPKMRTEISSLDDDSRFHLCFRLQGEAEFTVSGSLVVLMMEASSSKEASWYEAADKESSFLALQINQYLLKAVFFLPRYFCCRLSIVVFLHVSTCEKASTLPQSFLFVDKRHYLVVDGMLFMECSC
mmetsp:Transcript_9829/g.12973  ORF Transcript_9829/g.12973 Transcript_9829/m.12973 type:complete len:146 (-) Transcript_9829:48-485(-)